MNRILINDPRVPQFIAESVGSTDCACFSSIGLERDGQVIAGVSFDNYSGPNIFIHFSNRPDMRSISRDFLRLVFGYCFYGLKVKRVSAAFSCANEKVMRLGRLVGFKPEARLRDVFPEGDMCIWRVYREECRFC